MQKEDFYYDSRDNLTKIHATKYIPETTPTCVVQIVHGMAECIERYHEFAEFLAEKGCVVVLNDHLGHGKSLGEDKLFGYFCEQDPATVTVRDIHRLKKMTQAQYPGIPYFIIGHSMGSFVLRNYLYKYGAGIDGAVLLGTGGINKLMLIGAKLILYPQILLFGERAEGHFCNKVCFGNYNARIKEPKTSFDWLTSVEEEVDKYIANPACGNVFTLNGFKTLLELMNRAMDKKAIRNMPKELPLLIMSGVEDPVGEYGQSVTRVHKLFTEAGMQCVEMKLWDNCRHELLHESAKQDVMIKLYEFIEKNIGEYQK